MKAEQLRKKYLDFFKKKGHSVIPSASLVPEHDPTVLFTTAGMHPLVPFLMGEDHPSGKRLVNVQKSMRTDDIDEVGDPWHNTFFEMLGNWSLGDYWKKEAIEWSFEFLTKELRLDPEKIHVTVFGGDKEIPGVPEDKESIEIWKSLGISESRIFKLGKEDNWWGPVGNTGPCGPDTEMFYDTGRPTHGEKCQPGETCGKYAEIWNDVFMEFNKTPDGKYEPLKQKNVDTGMGVERTLAILNEKESVYDTELFQPVMELLRKNSESFDENAARIVADHTRAAVFLIEDGVEPLSQDKHGSVLVKLITRAIAKSREIGFKGNLLDISNIYLKIFKEEYPELRENSEKIKRLITKSIDDYKSKALSDKAIEVERKRFEPMLEDPNNSQKLQDIQAQVASHVSGDHYDIGRLFSEFPKSITTVSGTAGTVSADLKMSYGIPPEESFLFVENLMKERELTFNKEEAKTNLSIVESLHKKISKKAGDKVFKGGLADHSDITVKGHTATHLLHQALRDVLGNAVHQTGSNITPERIRFDFSHSEKLTEDQIKKVEEIVNSKIKNDLKVDKDLMSAEDANKLGAIGLFKDKYAEKVSIYKIGNYSVEYCGGPHVKHTAEIGNFKIIKEKALGSGQRRIRAILD